MARLTADLRARAYLRQVQSTGGFGTVLRRGDGTAGDILLKVRPVRVGAGADPVVDVYAQATDADGRRCWMRLGRPGFPDETAADAAIARAVVRDPDLWVLELEPAAAGFPLAEPVLAE